MIEPRIQAEFARLLGESSEKEEILEKIEEKLEEGDPVVRALFVPVPEHYPFWTADLKINHELVRRFLMEMGFFRQQSIDPTPSRARNEALDTVRDDGGVLKTYGEIALRNWVREYIEENGDAEDSAILSNWIKYNIKDTAAGLPIMTGNPLSDGPGVCRIPFRNGIVEISKAKVELKSYPELRKHGSVREDAVRERDIDLSYLPEIDLGQPIVKQVPSSPFTKFIIYAFKRGIRPNASWPIGKNNPLWVGTDNPEWIEAVNGFETSVGYLLHRHHPSNPKAIIFVDSESMASHRAKGGTGKSLSLGSLGHLRNLTSVDGKRMNHSGGERFVFGGVDRATEIVLLNDVNKDIRFQDLFNAVTDDMETEAKNGRIQVIPKELKPKIGITSNYIITGDDTSSRRRQHIVSFGTFLNRVTELGNTDKSMSVEALVGCYLFENEFSAEDWNAFYRYNILCVQKYLNTGLITPTNQGYKQALLANTVGNDDVFEWMEAWVNKGGYEKGIALSKIYREFSADFVGDILLVRWDEKLFLDRLCEYVLGREDLDWNPDQEAEGDTRRKRRWKISDGKGGQEDGVKIVRK